MVQLPDAHFTEHFKQGLGSFGRNLIAGVVAGMLTAGLAGAVILRDIAPEKLQFEKPRPEVVQPAYAWPPTPHQFLRLHGHLASRSRGHHR